MEYKQIMANASMIPHYGKDLMNKIPLTETLTNAEEFDFELEFLLPFVENQKAAGRK